MTAKRKANKRYIPKLGDLVLIEWTDACSRDEWVYDKSIAVPPGCASTGFLMHKPSKEHPVYVINGDIMQDETKGRELSIPRGCVMKVRRLNVEE